MAQVRNVFSTLPEHAWVDPALLDNFMMCVRKAMGLHLGGLLFNTLDAVLELFERFASDADDSAIFVLNLIVDERSNVRYDPEPGETLDGIASLLELVKGVICSVPVVQSDLVSIPDYNSLMIVSSYEADVMVAHAKQRLAEIFSQNMKQPEHLRLQFQAYHFVLAEPYYAFPAGWHDEAQWKKLLPEWDRIWRKSRRWIDEIEVLAEDEEDVGIFVAITSGSPEQRFATQVLAGKARSIGDHIMETMER